MKRIAEVAGVSQSTVSRILSGADFNIPIGEETRERVLRISKELGYRPNPFARALTGAQTMLIGLIVREIADPFFGAAIDLIARDAATRGYRLVLGHAHSSGKEALALATLLDTRHCDALILLGDLRDEAQLIADLVADEIALVGLCRGPSGPDVPTINVDNRLGVRMGLDHLLSLGHRRIAFVDGGWPGDIRDRRSAYIEYMADHGLPVSKGYQHSATDDPVAGVSAARTLLALREPPTAIFVATDLLALGVMRGAALSGFSVPGTLSVVGFDDIPLAALSVPSLTSVRQPILQMAHLAVERVTSLAADRNHPVPTLELVTPELALRESTGPVAS